MDFKEKVVLGRTGLKVSRMGLAASYGIEAPAVEKAYHEYGINYFFVSSMRRKGMFAAMRNLIPDNRDKMVIAIQSYDHLGVLLKHTVEKNLKKLNTDYADILILGWSDYVPPRWIMNKVRKLKEQGKIRFAGISGHNRKTFGKIAQDPDSPIDVFMLRYNAVHPGAEKDIFPCLPKENRPGITTYTATCWKKLLNPKNMPPGEKPLEPSDCYRFVLSNKNVDVCLTGPANEAQLIQNLAALEKGPLSEKEMKRVRAIGSHIYGS